MGMLKTILESMKEKVIYYIYSTVFVGLAVIRVLNRNFFTRSILGAGMAVCAGLLILSCIHRWWRSYSYFEKDTHNNLIKTVIALIALIICVNSFNAIATIVFLAALAAIGFLFFTKFV